MIWTTTPWTIPVNQAIAYGANDHYHMFHAPDGRRFLIAFDLKDAFESRSGLRLDIGNEDFSGDELSSLRYIEQNQIAGSALAGAKARHPMAKLFETPLPFRGGVGGGVSPDGLHLDGRPHPNPSPEGEGLAGANIDPTSPLAEFFLRPRPFLDGSAFVTTDTGTGLVHMAPDHGEDDFDLCKAHGIDPVFAVEGDGKYRADWAWLPGQGSVINPKFNAPNGPICADLRASGGLLAASSDYRHSYPHSWRSKAKLIYRCTPQWFVPMDRPVTLPHAKTGAEKRWEGEGGAPAEHHRTLRQIATAAIAETRFIPEKGRNRIGAMVEGRPDWVLSRQRAWGVPITLFVNRADRAISLTIPQVNARIIAAINAQKASMPGTRRNAAHFLGQDISGDAYRDPEDYERVADILDVWFDSAAPPMPSCSNRAAGPMSCPPRRATTGPLADLYLEGSDQHRGWFQSSLLEGLRDARAHAPYKAVLTHGFTMDARGMKMSKSLGNTIDPIKVMETNGADIIRLWALTVDYHRGSPHR